MLSTLRYLSVLIAFGTVSSLHFTINDFYTCYHTRHAIAIRGLGGCGRDYCTLSVLSLEVSALRNPKQKSI